MLPSGVPRSENPPSSTSDRGGVRRVSKKSRWQKPQTVEENGDNGIFFKALPSAPPPASSSSTVHKHEAADRVTVTERSKTREKQNKNKKS